MLRVDAITTQIRTNVEDGKTLRIGNGSSILFWQDNWCASGSFVKAFPRLFALSLQKNCFITQMGDWVDGEWSWNMCWRRTLFDWENEEVVILQNCISNIAPRVEETDGVTWR